MKKSRRKFSSKFKAKVVLDALKERLTLQELSSKYELHPNQISTWKREFLDGAASVFDSPAHRAGKSDDKEKEQLYSKIGKLPEGMPLAQVSIDFLKKSLGQ